ncbi:MAG: glycosyltransferase family 2 protein [Candidatus Coatesbacteria bacterium]|nr:glycosyltransferase family 2 protein [Candidatus Coatesbacteria bacterium]
MEKQLHSLVFPVYNEEGNLNELYEKTTSIIDSLDEYEFEMIFVNDGSFDRTLEMLKEYASKDNRIKIISFSRNFGHQTAITAGIDASQGLTAIILDSDLQDPPSLIPKMIEKWKEGYNVVYAKRLRRKGESFFKLITAKLFYRMLYLVTRINIPLDTGDFRLIDRYVIDCLRQLPERNRYIRGLVTWIGFRQTGVEYERDQRHWGKTKYPFGKMMKLALDGISSFSVLPLKLASYFGFAMAFFSLVYILYIFYVKFFAKGLVQGWTSTVILISLFGGIQLICLGIIGEYIARIFDESKKRPLYIIKEVVNLSDKQKEFIEERKSKI